MSMNAAESANVIQFPVTKSAPRPIVRVVDPSDTDWVPVASPMYTLVDPGMASHAEVVGKLTTGLNTYDVVRAGNAYAVCRPGYSRWPLGIVSDHYKVTDHNATIAQLTDVASELVTPAGRPIMSGHGYHLAHAFTVRHMRSDEVAGVPVTSRLVVVHAHTGHDAMRASLVVYAGKDALGSVVRSRGLHVGSQTSTWRGDVAGMVETAVLAQDALIDLIRAASERVLTDADRDWFKDQNMVIRDKDARTALDAVRAWHRGHTRVTTWGVWERRMGDTAIVALCKLLGRQQYGAPLDAFLGGRRYGG